MKRKLVAIAGIAVCLLLGGCSLLKKEEEYHVLRIDSLQDEQRDEKIAVVMRGDIAEETSITVLAQIAGRSALSFPITGEDFGKSYISVGDRVKKGQLLMELDCDTFRQELKQVQYEEQNILIDREECEKLFQSSMDKKPDYKDSLRLKEEYQDAMEDYENRLEILQLRKAEYEKKIQERSLYADMDGVVTSNVFIGVHYEMCIEAGGFEWLAQNTTSYPVGTKVSIGVTPENIQIMHKPQSEDEEAISLDD